jgi:hypothetical protein
MPPARIKAPDWRDGNMVVFFGGGVDWPDVQNFFLVGVGEPLIGKRERPNNDHQNSKPRHRFHEIYLYANTFALFHSIRQLLRGQNNSRTGVHALVETIS